jgi:putative CocE/NonD family hydrolase
VLATQLPASDQRFDVHHEPGTTGSGHRSRWRSLFSLVPGDYPDRAVRGARLLVYRSEPLSRDVRVAGHPEVELFVGFGGEPEGELFVYLEDEAPDGRVALVTEGVLASRFRERSGPEPCRSVVPLRRFHQRDARALEPSEVAHMAFDLLPIAWLFRAGHRLRLALAGADADHFAVCGERTLQVYRSPERASRLHLPVLRG